MSIKKCIYSNKVKLGVFTAWENVCYMLLAFISFKMEVHWRSNPIGKVRNNLPFFKRLAEKNLHNSIDSIHKTI